MARGFNPDDTNLWGDKSKAVIDKCLNCEKPSCNNCLDKKERIHKGRYKGGYVQIKHSTGNVVAVYDSAYEAAEKVGLSPTTIYRYVYSGQPVNGYFWKKKSEVEGLV